MPEIIRDTSTVAFNFDRCAKLVSSTIASALPNAKYQQSINECEKPHFAGKSAGRKPFPDHAKNPSHGFLRSYDLCPEVTIALRATESLCLVPKFTALRRSLETLLPSAGFVPATPLPQLRITRNNALSAKPPSPLVLPPPKSKSPYTPVAPPRSADATSPPPPSHSSPARSK